MNYTGLENYTDGELIAMIERSGDAMAHELVRRSADVAAEIEDYKATIDNLQTELEEAEERTGIAELKTKLQVAEDRATDFERKAKKLEGENRRMQENFNKFKAAFDKRVASLEAQIADAPATW